MGKTFFLQIVNLVLGIMPLTRWYRLKTILLNLAGISCSSSARIVSSVKIVSMNVAIGKNTFIGHQVLIGGSFNFKIEICDNVDIAPRVCILSGSHEIDMKGEHSAGIGSGGNIKIDNGAWIGANSTILPGVVIGEKAVIGAGSIVIRDIPPFTIAVGNPCIPIKKWNKEKDIFEPIF